MTHVVIQFSKLLLNIGLSFNMRRLLDSVLVVHITKARSTLENPSPCFVLYFVLIMYFWYDECTCNQGKFVLRGWLGLFKPLCYEQSVSFKRADECRLFSECMP